MGRYGTAIVLSVVLAAAAVTTSTGPAGAGLSCVGAPPDGQIQLVPNAFQGVGVKSGSGGSGQTVSPALELGDKARIKIRFLNDTNATTKIRLSYLESDPGGFDDFSVKAVIGGVNVTAQLADGKHVFRNIPADGFTPTLKLVVTGSHDGVMDAVISVGGRFPSSSCQDLLRVTPT